MQQAFGGAAPGHRHAQQVLSPAYFQGAPLSKFVTIFIAVAHAVLEMGGLRGTTTISLDYDAILLEGQIHRLFLYPITFSTIGELVMGLAVLCPLMHRFEREMGTHKFAANLFMKCIFFATIFQCIVLECFALESTFATGPYPHIGALLFLYHQYTPKLYPHFFGMLGFDFSEKSLTYAFAFQFILSRGYPSCIPSLCGYFASFISFHPSSPLAQWDPKLPHFSLRFAEWIGDLMGLNHLLHTPPLGTALSAASGRRRFPQRNTTGMAATELNETINQHQTAQFEAPPPPPPPSPEAIEQLTMMGFDRDAVIQALQATDNNVEAAANRLLTG